MTAKTKNNKSTWIIAFFFVVVFLLVILRPGNNQDRTLLPVPKNSGFPELKTVGDRLIANQNGGNLYLFDWTNLGAGHSLFPSLSQKSVLLQNQLPIALSLVRNDVIATDKDGREQFRISGGEAVQTSHLVTAAPADTVIYVAEKKESDGFSYSIEKVDVQGRYLLYCCGVGPYRDFELTAFALSDDGSTLVAAGRRENRGYLAVIDIQAQTVRWEKEVPDMTPFSAVCISPDGQSFYVGSRGGTLSMLEAQNGDITNTVVLVDEPRQITNSMTIRTLAASSDGQWIGAVCSPEVFILDRQTCTLQKTVVPGSHKITVGLAFSPDGTKIATSDLRAGSEINIIDWQTD